MLEKIITPEVINQFYEDGAICLKGIISEHWIKSLTEGLDHNINNPSERGRLWNKDAEGNTCFYDSQAWRYNERYKDFVMNSPMAEIAGRVMNVNTVNFFFDAIFVRTPGNQFRTPFHQDEPYWSVEGFNACSTWMPLVSVEKKSALEFVRGSHRWNERFAQTNFGALTGDTRDQVIFDDNNTEPFPDIEGNRDQYDILSWDMEPGDIAMFNARTIHGGSGRLRNDRGLKVFNTQWLGDGVKVNFRPEGMDPDHSQVMTEVGLKPGDKIGGDLYPELWQR